MSTKKNTATIEVLKENLEFLSDASKWLKRSYNQCKDINIGKSQSEDDFDKFESLTSRFARAIDFLIHKVFRSIDTYEFEDGGTILDVINHAHKRNIFESIDEIRALKDLRNDIAHNYHDDSLTEIFIDTLSYTPSLIKLIENTQKYCERYF